MRNARFSITISQSSSFRRSFPAQGQTEIPVLSWSGCPDILLLGKRSPDFRFGCRPDSPVRRKYTLFPQVSVRPHSHNRSAPLRLP
jgi:hypothetical protein